MDIDLDEIAAKTEGFSGSDLDRAFAMAVQKLFRRKVKLKENVKNGAKIVDDVRWKFSKAVNRFQISIR